MGQNQAKAIFDRADIADHLNEWINDKIRDGEAYKAAFARDIMNGRTDIPDDQWEEIRGELTDEAQRRGLNVGHGNVNFGGGIDEHAQGGRLPDLPTPPVNPGNSTIDPTTGLPPNPMDPTTGLPSEHPPPDPNSNSKFDPQKEHDRRIPVPNTGRGKNDDSQRESVPKGNHEPVLTWVPRRLEAPPGLEFKAGLRESMNKKSVYFEEMSEEKSKRFMAIGTTTSPEDEEMMRVNPLRFRKPLIRIPAPRKPFKHTGKTKTAKHGDFVSMQNSRWADITPNNRMGSFSTLTKDHVDLSRWLSNDNQDRTGHYTTSGHLPVAGGAYFGTPALLSKRALKQNRCAYV